MNKMRILVIGSGGREHALVWKLAQSKLVDKVFCAPGNGGIRGQAECVDIKADDIHGLCEFARKEKIDLTVVGPEGPLTLGIADEFALHKLNIFAPGRKAAQLEGSKVFAKQLMKKYNVPTADFKVFEDPDKAVAHIEELKAPCVVKADGLAAGKGVIVAQTPHEAVEAVDLIMRRKAFGEAGRRVIIEECLQGEEASILVFTDSREVVSLASSQDHKRAFDRDKGPNTGGMGAYSPAPLVTPGIWAQINETIIDRTLDGLAREGIEYRGVLYAGIMVTPQGPKVLEYNVRFGDPETECVIPRLQSDLAEVMLAVSSRSLRSVSKSGGLKWDERFCVCVVACSGGYPGAYETGKNISGLAQAAACPDSVVFHSGTRQERSGSYVTAGGRVLTVSGLGKTAAEAREASYRAVSAISFEGMHYRSDIAAKALSGQES